MNEQRSALGDAAHETPSHDGSSSSGWDGMTVDEVATRYGSFKVPRSEQDLIGRFLRRYGEWARNEVRFVAEALPDSPVRVLDLGAFLGTFGIGLSAEHPVESLLLVEANARITPLLRENVRVNARAPSEVIEALVAPADLAVTGSFESGNLGSLSFAELPPADDRVSVPPPGRRVSLAELRHQFGPFDLIKMDVEGLEHAILAADTEAMQCDRVAFWLECNETAASLDLAELLLSAGLSVFYFAFPAFARENFRGASEILLPLAFESGLWASRRRSPPLPDELRRQGCILRPIASREDLRRALWRTPRWGRLEWEGESAQSLAAEAGHALRGEEYSRFLRVAASDYDQMEKALRHAEGLLEEVREEARALRTGLQEAENGLRHAESVLHAERADFQAVQRTLQETQQELHATQIVLQDEKNRLSQLLVRWHAQDVIAARDAALATQARSRLKADWDGDPPAPTRPVSSGKDDLTARVLAVVRRRLAANATTRAVARSIRAAARRLVGPYR